MRLLLAAVALAAVAVIATPASSPDQELDDVCANVPGVQTLLDVSHNRWDHHPTTPGDCVPDPGGPE